jgi:hypothetical protein
MGDETLWCTRRVSVYKGSDPGRPGWKSRFYRLQTFKNRSLVSAPAPGLLLRRPLDSCSSVEGTFEYDKTNGALAAPVGSEHVDDA